MGLYIVPVGTGVGSAVGSSVVGADGGATAAQIVLTSSLRILSRPPKSFTVTDGAEDQCDGRGTYWKIQPMRTNCTLTPFSAARVKACYNRCDLLQPM